MGANSAGRLGVALLLVASLIAPFGTAFAAPEDVVINEIMYHPASDLDADEFIEIANPGATAVDVSNWCLDGVTFCFDPGTTIVAGGFLVVASDAGQFQATYGFVPDGVFASGSVSNGGEALTLTDDVGAIIDLVEYDDAAPWPTTPDGLGPSLELIDASLDNNDPFNWAASTAPLGHTAGSVNSVAGSGLPLRITEVTATPGNPGTNDDVTVTAHVVGATDVTLTYRVNFAGEQSLAMSPTGDDDFAAVIPDQSAGDLIRYRITADDGVEVAQYPTADDTINYEGVVVAHGISSNLPILEWFIADADYDDIVDDPTNDIERTGVLAYNGVVIDNVLFNIRGSHSQTAPKVNWKAEMPQGHDLDMPGLLADPVDEFALQADWSDHAHGRSLLSWDSYQLGGVINTQVFKVRVERNGDFQGLYSYVDLFDGTWREREGYDDDEFFKASTGAFNDNRVLDNVRFEKKNPGDEDYATLAAFLDGVALNGNAQRNYLLENADIPQMINYAAVTAIIEHVDSSSKNFYLTPDSATERWRILPWDLDHTLGNGCCSVDSDFVTPAEPGDKTNDLMVAIFDQPDWEDMYFRRLATLVDQILAPGRMEAVYDARVGPAQPEAALDFSVWPHSSWHNYNQQRTVLFGAIQARRNAFAGDSRVPGPQAAAPDIVINELNYAPAVGGDGEYIELYNPSSTQAIDLSGWSISDAITLEIQPGTVILPESYMVFIADDPTFRSTYGSTIFVGDRYSGGLSSSGETVTLRRGNGSVADQVTFGGAGWADAQDGPSLELIDPTLDNDDPTNWGVSNQPLGTPGTANDPGEPGGPGGGEPASIIVNEYNGVSDPNLLGGGAAVDPFWGAVAGNGGDWFELVVIEDHLDMRGVQIEWTDDTGGAGETSGTLVFSNHDLWSDVRAGTIVTVAEGLTDDASYDPAADDWWIHVQAAATAGGTYITAADFSTSNDNTQLTILAADDSVLFGPAGEGIEPASGVGSDEVFALHENPSDAIEPTSIYDDSTESTFGAPNTWDDGVSAQDFSVLRPVVSPPVPDTVDPVTGLVFPVEGSVLDSTAVTLSGDASDDVDVDRVEVGVQNTVTGEWLQPDGSFQAVVAVVEAVLVDDLGVSTGWELAATLPEGAYTASATAFDTSGNSDGSPPTVSFTVELPDPGDDQDVVISEMMYHPASDNEDEEFIELTNHGTDPVDISGWCFDGITFCFPSSTIISAGGIVVLAPDATVFAGTYGFTPDGEYTSSLSNGGEEILLSNASAVVVDIVEYDDAPPWPITPDGGGPSMEVISLSGDNNDPWNWAASTAPAGHTAGAPNSVALAAAPPAIDDVTASPSRPNPNQALTIDATVRHTTGVSLTYRIGFGPVTTLPMTPVGGDVYRATVPGQSAGELIRYRVEAEGTRDASLPRADGTATYLGATVADLTLGADLPVLEWFMLPADYDDMLANHRFDDQYFNAVFAYDGVVYDAVQVRVRGDSSRELPKVSLDVEFPDGHLFDLPGLISGPVDQFALNATAQTVRDPITMPSAFAFQNAAGEFHRDYASLHVQLNGEFQGLFGYVEILDDKWRERHGMDDWTVYKPDSPWGNDRPITNTWDKKNPDDGDYSDLQEMLDGIDNPTTEWLFDNFDIPGMVNFAALETLLRNETGSAKNFYMVRNTGDTDRWRGHLWDVNNTFKCGCDFVPPLNNEILAALVADPRFREMHDRRVRTLLDDFLYTGQWEAWFNQYHDEVESTRLLDDAKWGNGTAADALDELVDRLNNKYEPFYIDAPPIPPSATGATPVVINEIHNDPLAGGDAEFLELRNLATTESIDLSGWTITEAFDFTFPAGSVILADDTLVIVDTDAVFRSTSGNGLFVAGQWDGGLSSGETIELRSATGAVVDTVTYGGVGWPEATNGESLELINPTGDHNDPVSWALSLAPGGTPDSPNQVSPPVPDTVDPVTGLVFPVEGSVLDSTAVTLSGDASDDVDVDRVEVGVQNTVTGEWLQPDGSFQAVVAVVEAVLVDDLGVSTGWELAATLPEGAYAASATAFDTSGNSDGSPPTVSFTVEIDVPDTEVAFRAVATASLNRTSVPVTVPNGVQAGDVLVLFVQGNRNDATVVSAPAGWTLLDSEQDDSTESWLYWRVAPAGYGGSSVAAEFSVRMKTGVTLVAYSGASGVSAFASATASGSSADLEAPSVDVVDAGSVVVSHWGDKTSGHSGWTLPDEMTEIASTSISGGGAIITATGASESVGAGLWPGATATSGTSGSKAIAWSVVIAPE